VTLLRRVLLALWAGLLVTVGGLVAPTLFAVLPSRLLAGFIAGELFRRVTLISLALGVVLALVPPGPAPRARSRRLGALLPALVLAISEYGVRPQLEAARAAGGPGGRAFVQWHAVSASLYVVATLLALALLVDALRESGAERPG